MPHLFSAIHNECNRQPYYHKNGMYLLEAALGEALSSAIIKWHKMKKKQIRKLLNRAVSAHLLSFSRWVGSVEAKSLSMSVIWYCAASLATCCFKVALSSLRASISTGVPGPLPAGSMTTLSMNVLHALRIARRIVFKSSGSDGIESCSVRNWRIFSADQTQNAASPIIYGSDHSTTSTIPSHVSTHSICSLSPPVIAKKLPRVDLLRQNDH